MPLNLASPGIIVREVDLTNGRVDPTSNATAAIVAPFAKGPVESAVIATNEQELLANFGEPYSVGNHYESWFVASSYLAYGGNLQVLRSDGVSLKNAKVGSGSPIKIKSYEDYVNKGYDENPITNVTFAARNPGSWANGLKIAVIDGKADQILTVNSTSGLSVGLGVTQSVPANTVLVGSGTTSLLDGYFKGIITGVDSVNSKVDVKLLSRVSAAGTVTNIDYTPNGVYKFAGSSANITFVGTGAGSTSFTATRGSLGFTAGTIGVGVAITTYNSILSTTLDNAGGESLTDSATSLGISTSGISTGTGSFLLIDNELISIASASISTGTISGITRGQVGTSATDHTDGTAVRYLKQYSGIATLSSAVNATETVLGLTTTRTGLSTIFSADSYAQFSGSSEFVRVNAFLSGDIASRTVASAPDWFDQQTITLTNSTVNWNSLANRPSTSTFASTRGTRFDEVHVVVIDGDGGITGNEGTILEKHLSLSKAKNAVYSVGSPSYWNKYVSEGSSFIFAGSEPTGVVTCGFSAGFTLATNGDWNTNTGENLVYDCIGSQTYSMTGGLNYDGGSNLSNSNALDSSLTDLSSGYDLLTNAEQYDIDFILMGSAGYTKETAQALASKIVAVAEERKDAIAFISPYKSGLLQASGTESYSPISASTITDNVVGYYSAIPSSSFAIFDSGYKYMYDKFSGTFRYIPLNGDIAGLCARNDAQGAPWTSPAGTSRGAILNAVKLAYNPSKLQRDVLFSNRINPVIFSPGSGIILFGDRTGLAKASSFDRINVRRLFIYIENAISAAAKDQLFEFNDNTTRSTFVNIVEPFLRDIQAKRGIIDFRVVCDETNNTAAVIDNNEFIADIYIKPSRSINFIGLTFVATRTGVSFEEIVGTV